MLGAMEAREVRLPEMKNPTPMVEMHFEVVHISPVRALVYTYPRQGGLREVALVWRPDASSAWRCALCNLGTCMHLRAFEEAPQPSFDSED